jgi:hypothetical protein
MCIHNLIIDERIYDEENTEMRALVQNEGRRDVEFAECGPARLQTKGFGTPSRFIKFRTTRALDGGTEFKRRQKTLMIRSR